jgi:molecular chaperone HtpG
MSFESQPETLGFEAEVTHLLDLVAKSLYSNKEIFLRELISNASDAADKLRYQALSDAALYEQDSELKIWVDFDKDNRTLTIRDNGIGMSREEAIENLGTIAKSGTRAFKELIGSDDASDSQLIGQFGVGFYSAFIISDKVVVRTRRAGMTAEQGVEWESDGKGKFQVKNIHRSARGTEIILHLNKDQEEFLDDMRLRGIIKKYSDHIVLPIAMNKPIDPTDNKDDKTIEVPEEEIVNSAKALWTLAKSQISKEEYQELYKHISHDFEDPLAWAHNKVEGKLEYTSLLYVPGRAPFDLWMREQRSGLKLYVKRIFIMDDAEHFMPIYLRFVKGVIDSNDLPLNISREILQSNRMIDRMRSACVKRVLDMLEKMAENDKDSYEKFWIEFGEVLKEGPAEDFANKDRIANLLRFSTTQDDSEKQSASLKDYISRMPEDQESIYYITADNFMAAKNSPLLEVFRKKSVEVLLLTSRVDEWFVNSLPEFDGKKLKSVSQGTLDLGKLDDEDTKKEQKEKEKTFDSLISSIKKALGDTVKDVRLTHRLTDSPTCVVYDDADMSGHMQRLMQSAGQQIERTAPILELNPDHALLAKVNTETDEQRVNRWAKVLLNQALLSEGEQLENPADFVKEMNILLVAQS